MPDAGLSNSPGAARFFEVPDAQLSAELKKWTGAAPALHPVGELLDRHWEAGFAYARLCTADTRTAGMLTTAAFTRLFGETLRQTGPTAAWRPRLLVTVGRIAAEWDADHRRELLHPGLRSGPDGVGAAARLQPPDHRRLLSEAFARLPQSARCLLWHTEVEAEPASVPAALLGMDAETGRLELERARDRLREELLQVHRELAPEHECRQYLRMLDVTYRRGGVDVDPDLRAHLNRCAHCSGTADQLGVFNGGLGIALAESVLGWGARAYLIARVSPGAQPPVSAPDPYGPIAGESFFADTGAAASAARPHPSAFTSVTAPDTAGTPAGVPGPRSARRAARRSGARREPTGPARRGARACSSRVAVKVARRAARRRNLSAAVATVSALVVLPLVIWSAAGSDGGTDDTAVPTAHGQRPSGSASPEKDAPSRNPAWAGAAEAAKGDLRGRLHNIGSGLCVAVVGGRAVEGAETELTACAPGPAQEWTYETDGLIRSAADPGLCLDSHLGYSVRLAPCQVTGAGGDDVRYDFTLPGALIPRFDQELALSPAATDGSGALVLKSRDDDNGTQHWAVDTARTTSALETVTFAPKPAAAVRPAPPPAHTPAPPSAHTPATKSARTAPPPTAPPAARAPGAPAGEGGPRGGGRGPGGGAHR
ncbi:RICIN domain-containing protein [Streptomyces sp. SS1-1]|uniref:RICIN domain-containing protein n=1 Tax=Streptomyces sp. SS1-1 TaxID=2651869 RepID=UPI001CEF8324|nr:RICIN domain-containing protein [Streptomyces sp. SS1-1]